MEEGGTPLLPLPGPPSMWHRIRKRLGWKGPQAENMDRPRENLTTGKREQGGGREGMEVSWI